MISITAIIIPILVVGVYTLIHILFRRKAKAVRDVKAVDWREQVRTTADNLPKKRYDVR